MSARRRKAWRVTVRDRDNTEIFYAPTAGKARSMAWSRLYDVSETRIVDITARREPAADVMLPARDPVADELTEQERHCLLHAFGANTTDPTKAGYRDYFYTRRDDPPLVALTDRGLMKPTAGDQWGENMTYFVMTDLGRHVALSIVPEYPPDA